MNQICISNFQYFHQDAFSWFKNIQQRLSKLIFILLRSWNYMSWQICWEISKSFSSDNSFPEKESRSLKRKQNWKPHYSNSHLKGMVVFWEGQECWEECQDERLKADAEGRRSVKSADTPRVGKVEPFSHSFLPSPSLFLRSSVPWMPAHVMGHSSGLCQLLLPDQEWLLLLLFYHLG